MLNLKKYLLISIPSRILGTFGIIFLFILIAVFPARVALAAGYSSSDCGSTIACGPTVSTDPTCCICLAGSDTGKTLGCYALDITNMLWNIVVPLLFVIVTIIFMYGVMNYVWHGGDKTKRAEGLQYIIWGLVGLFVMFSVWGLVNILSATFNLKNTQPDIPTFEIEDIPTFEIE